jgi:AraC family transcriptional regulator, transcriptional activator of pobA
MTSKKVFTLVNPLNGKLAFKIFSFRDNSSFDHLQRLNYYSVILITKGQGFARAEA